MNDACHLTILELQRSLPHPPLTAKKGDTGRKLQFLLTDNGAPYIISSECRAVFTAQKPDGNILYNTCQIDGNTITYTFTPQTCSVVGALACELKLYGADDKLITSSQFTLFVEDSVYSAEDVTESATEVSALTGLISETATLLADVEQKLADNAFADAHSAVCWTEQSLTDAQQSQARQNISAASGFRRILTADDDMDSITGDGIYVYSTASVPTNAPFANAAVVMVFGNDSTTTQKVQMAWRYGENGYFKFRALFAGSWFAWTEVLNSVNGCYELLWENASKTSSFAAQSLSVNTNGYDHLLVVCGYNTAPANGGGTTHIRLRSKGEGDTRACLTVDYFYETDGALIRPFRNMKVYNGRTKIDIGDCYKYTNSIDNGNCIPYYIYGIKGVMNP